MDQPTEKTCTKCGEVKDVSEFHRRSSAPDGRANGCKGCVKAYDQAHRERNRDRLVAASAAYYAEHRDEINARNRKRREDDPDWAEEDRARARSYYMRHRAEGVERARQWRLANPEKFAEHQRRWREVNPDRVREWSRARMARLRAEDPEGWAARIREWRQANKDMVRAAKAAWIEANPERHQKAERSRRKRYAEKYPDKIADGRHRRRARIAQVSFGRIDLAEVWATQDGRCGICDLRLDRTLKFPDPLSPSLDHIIPISKGGPHSQDNVRWTCLICNLRKGAKLPE